MEKNYQILISKINESQNNLIELRVFSETDFITWGNKVKEYHRHIMESPHVETAISENEKKKEVLQLQTSFSKIIVDLQFHDIINQLITHINKILLELKTETKFYSEHKQYSGSSFIRLVPKLMFLVIDLLKLIDTFYTTATNDVKSVFFSSLNNQELYKILNLNVDEADNHAVYFNEVTQEIIADARTIAECFQQIGIIGDNHHDSLFKIGNIFTMEKERELLCNVFEIEYIEQDIDSIDLF